MEIFRLASKLLTGTGRKTEKRKMEKGPKKKCTLLEKIFENNLAGY